MSAVAEDDCRPATRGSDVIAADIVGSRARAGTALVAFQMVADLGSIVGSFAVGQIAEHLAFRWAFIISGIILLGAALAWVLAPETRRRAPLEPTLGRALGPVAGGEVPDVRL